MKPNVAFVVLTTAHWKTIISSSTSAQKTSGRLLDRFFSELSARQRVHGTGILPVRTLHDTVCLEVKGDSHKLIKLRSSKSELLLQRCYQAIASARNCPSNLCTSSHPDKTVSRPTPGTTDGGPAEEILWIRAHTHTRGHRAYHSQDDYSHVGVK